MLIYFLVSLILLLTFLLTYPEKVKFLLEYSIDSLIKILRYLKRSFFVKTENLVVAPYDDLTPTILEKEENYSEAILWGLQNKNIKNLALTGTYGSGKSSILLTFQNKHPQYKYLNISLATFCVNDDNNFDEKINLIEQSILQQIFYHVKETKIPDSRFKRIKNLKAKKLGLLSFSIVLWLNSVLIVLFPQILCDYIFFAYIYENWYYLIRYLSLLLAFSGSVFWLSHIIRVFYNSQFNKFNLKSGEFEISKSLESSILNKHLDEILYFFEATKYNVVVIEDLDRFNNVEIFTKLRELNLLINGAEQIEGPVKFIYAVKDDIFVDSSRTKFFDFIIPVIPVINSSNSLEILSNKLKDANTPIDKDFLSEITLYIDDMRMLKNIFNEFIIYNKQLGNLGLDLNKLLGIIIYKNIYPEDFSLLHKNRGAVYNCFNEKPNLIRQADLLLEDEISIIENKISYYNSIILQNELELRNFYTSLFIQKLPNDVCAIQILDLRVNLNSIWDFENFKNLLSLSEIKCYYLVNGSDYNQTRLLNFTLSGLKDSSGKTFIVRNQEIKDGRNTEIEKLVLSLEKIKLRKIELCNLSLSEIINSEMHEVNLDSISDKDVLIYLLRNGYIDEMYHSYISFFYEGKLTKSDMDFVLSIKNKKALPFGHQLNKVSEIIKLLRPAELNRIQVFNFNFLDFILESDKYENELLSKLSLIQKADKISIDFLCNYIDQGKKNPVFISKICHVWKGFWETFEKLENVSIDKKNHVLKLIIQNCGIEEIILLNRKKALSSYIENNKDFLLLMEDEVEKAILVIKTLDLKLKIISYPISSVEIFDFVYENNHYEINVSTIESVLKEKCANELFNDNDFSHKNYSLIMSSDLNQLKNYIDINIEFYLENVLFEIESNTKEDNSYLLQLIQKLHSKDYGYIGELIQSQDNVFKDINDLNIENWSLVFLERKIYCDWKNIEFYHKEFGLNDVLIGYFNDSEINQSLSKKKYKYEELSLSQFSLLRSILECDELSLQNYKSLLRVNPCVYNILNLDYLNKEKVLFLIDNKKLNLNSVNYINIKSKDLHIYFIEDQKNTFLSFNDQINIDAKDFQQLLESNIFTINEKIKIIKRIDLSLLTYKNNLANKILDIFVEINDFDFEYQFLMAVLKYSNVPKNKIIIFNKCFEFIKSNSIAEALKQIGVPYSNLRIISSKQTIPLTIENEIFIKNLKDNGSILSYKIDNISIKVTTKKTKII